MPSLTRTQVFAALTAALVLAPSPAQAQQDGAAWWRHVEVLAHDSLKGRDTGSPGHESASRYIAEQFAAIGLQPAGTSGWMQPVDFVATRFDEPNVRLTLRAGATDTPLTLGADVRLTARASTRDVEAPLVFVGYGISLPSVGVDDLAGLDVRGKIVVHVNAAPRALTGPLIAHGTRSRWQALRAAGAVGIIAIGPTAGWSTAGASPFGTSLALADSTLDDSHGQLISALINPVLMPSLLSGTALNWESISALAARGEPLPTGALNVSLRATLPTLRRSVVSPNVVGFLPGTDPQMRNEVVVLSAHSDHVGTLTGPGVTGDSIFNGAMDNASGIATLIETARAVVRAGGNRRSIAFVAVTAEEKGLLGSRYFAAHPSMRAGTIVANLNTDMFLPLIPLTGLFVYGIDESDLADDVRAVAQARNIQVIPDPDPQDNRFVRSDQYSFIRQGIPALAFKFGYLPGTPEEVVWKAWNRDHYHKVSDDLTRGIDRVAAAAFNAMYAELALRVANRGTPPAWRRESFFAPR